MFIDSESIISDLKLIRSQKPLVHNVTNYVSMSWVANGLLALGASPIMAHALEEVADLVQASKALVINIGTLSTPWIAGMKVALDAAIDLDIPVILDPVGAGATAFRTATARDLLVQGGVTVIRGNASEICALAGESSTTRGVDSSLLTNAALNSAKRLHEEFGCTVIVSGQEDLILGEFAQARVYNGTAMMTRVTGMGCLASAVVGAFCAIQKDPTKAAANAMAYFGIVGERAANSATGPGSYSTLFLDLLSDLPYEAISKSLTVESYVTQY